MNNKIMSIAPLSAGSYALFLDGRKVFTLYPDDGMRHPTTGHSETLSAIASRLVAVWNFTRHLPPDAFSLAMMNPEQRRQVWETEKHDINPAWLVIFQDGPARVDFGIIRPHAKNTAQVLARALAAVSYCSGTPTHDLIRMTPT